MKEGGVEVNRFNDSLIRIVGHDQFAPTLPADLSDLRWTIEKCLALLIGIRDGTLGAEEEWSLLHLEIMLEDDIPMIVRDILPELKALGQVSENEDPGAGQDGG